MARVSDDEVKEIISTTIDTTPFITAANLVINNNSLLLGLDDDLLKEIERWLAAHLVCSREMRVESKKIGEASEKYKWSTGLGLDSTLYGQQVKLLDPTKQLEGMSKRSASVETIRFDIGV